MLLALVGEKQPGAKNGNTWPHYSALDDALREARNHERFDPTQQTRADVHQRLHRHLWPSIHPFGGLRSRGRIRSLYESPPSSAHRPKRVEVIDKPVYSDLILSGGQGGAPSIRLMVHTSVRTPHSGQGTNRGRP
ncbi:MAG: hypothetical protein ACI8X5_001705 [Planctomycetota bacterium]|jgi:hypothetical protein